MNNFEFQIIQSHEFRRWKNAELIHTYSMPFGWDYEKYDLFYLLSHPYPSIINGIDTFSYPFSSLWKYNKGYSVRSGKMKELLIIIVAVIYWALHVPGPALSTRHTSFHLFLTITLWERWCMFCSKKFRCGKEGNLPWLIKWQSLD